MNNPPSPGRRRALRKLGGAALLAGTAATGGVALVNRFRNLVSVRRAQTLMQTSVAIQAVAEDEHQAGVAIDAAFARMAATAAQLTRFDATSPVARLNTDGHLSAPPPALRTVLTRALAMSERSSGDFDITVLPVLDYYLAQHRPINPNKVNRSVIRARELAVGYRNVEVTEDGVRFLKRGMAITLDGIAKGYVIDEGIEALKAAGVNDALIDAGGEIRATSSHTGRHSWHVGIVDPIETRRIAAVLQLRNGAVSTSGNYEVFFSADRRLFHIINPHTGYSPDRYSSVTVMAPQAIESDAASVACFSMGLAKMEAFLARDGHEWLVMSWDGAKRFRSRGLPLIHGHAQVI